MTRSDISSLDCAPAPFGELHQRPDNLACPTLRRVTLRSIAEIAGCSKNTVSLALRNDPQLPLHTRERIRKTAEKMGYQPDAVFSHLMAQLRLGQTAGFKAKLALVNAHRDPDALRTHPTIQTYVAGCANQANRLGYSFDNFWLHDSDLTASRWTRILNTRAIKGLIVVGLMHDNHLPEHLRAVWDQFPTVVTGVRTRKPALPFSCVDHFNLIRSAFEKAIDLGYHRPGLVIDEAIDRLVERRFSAGMLASQEDLREKNRIPPFMGAQESQTKLPAFHQWFGRHKPDVIFTLYNDLVHWLKATDISVPRDVGIIQLDWCASHPQFAGMNQHNEVTGAAAVDMIVEQIHHNQKGLPAVSRARLIGSNWMDGPSVTYRQQERPRQAAVQVIYDSDTKRIAS